MAAMADQSIIALVELKVAEPRSGCLWPEPSVALSSTGEPTDAVVSLGVAQEIKARDGL